MPIAATPSTAARSFTLFVAVCWLRHVKNAHNIQIMMALQVDGNRHVRQEDGKGYCDLESKHVVDVKERRKTIGIVKL